MAMAETSSCTSKEANSRATNEGRYQYDDGLLGFGAFGSVLKARDKRNKGEVVAIKIVKAQKSLMEYLSRKTPLAVKGTRKEAELLNRLQHEHVIGIRDQFEFKSGRTMGLAIVMDYCSGGNLQTRLELLNYEDRLLEAPKRLQWYIQLATGLQYIHSEEIVHRDLKPANILIDTHDDLKIADIGVAKAIYDIKSSYNELENSTYQQYMQTLAGSPAYMAPEVWEQHYKTASDVFSMGLLMLVICEIPDPPIPEAQFDSKVNSLGVLMYLDDRTRNLNASSLLQVCNCPATELDLFDCMLQYDYKERPSMNTVVERLEEMKKLNENKSTDGRIGNQNQSSCVML